MNQTVTGAWIVGYLNGLTGSPAASYVFMGGSLVIAVVLTALTTFSSGSRSLISNSSAY